MNHTPYPRRPVRSFVTRAGRMGPGQQRALQDLGPRFVLPFQTTPLDLAATFGDYAGTPVASAAHSRSLRPLIEGQPGAARDHALNEWRLGESRCGVALDLRTVRTRDAKLTLELGSGAGELYDLANDPFECENRFDDPACRGLRQELTDRLMARPPDIRTAPDKPVGPA